MVKVWENKHYSIDQVKRSLEINDVVLSPNYDHSKMKQSLEYFDTIRITELETVLICLHLNPELLLFVENQTPEMCLVSLSNYWDKLIYDMIEPTLLGNKTLDKEINRMKLVKGPMENELYKKDRYRLYRRETYTVGLMNDRLYTINEDSPFNSYNIQVQSISQSSITNVNTGYDTTGLFKQPIYKLRYLP